MDLVMDLCCPNSMDGDEKTPCKFLRDKAIVQQLRVSSFLDSSMSF